MLVLGIETSCDETGIALVADGVQIRGEAVASQNAVHAPYAGVVPELASRQHLRLLAPLLEQCLLQAGVELTSVDLVAVTRGPGLAGCLLAGASFAKALAYGINKPIIGVNHIEAHIHSCSLAGVVRYPAVALVVSGGHTMLVLQREPFRYELIGETRDDAVGEAYDKVASLLGLSFPGGPAVERRAREAKTGNVVRFPRPLLGSGDMDFSFSGLKTAVLHYMRKNALSEGGSALVAAGFQDAVVEVLVKKTMAAALRSGARTILLAGGVAQNQTLRSQLEHEAGKKTINVICSPPRYCTDNGVMIAALTYHRYMSGARDDWSLDIEPGLRLC